MYGVRQRAAGAGLAADVVSARPWHNMRVA
jgi:hypothetical protein